MIIFDPLWETLKEKQISTYTLIHKFNVSRNLIHKLRHNESVTTTTLNDLCRILDCELSDITKYIPEEPEKSSPASGQMPDEKTII